MVVIFSMLYEEIIHKYQSGKCWFGADSKSFEILVEVVNERVEGIALEKGRGFSSWIKFREKNLSLLLERVELCCHWKRVSPYQNVWKKGGRLEFQRWSRVIYLVLSGCGGGGGVAVFGFGGWGGLVLGDGFCQQVVKPWGGSYSFRF